MNFDTMSKQRRWVLISVAWAIISIFLPWVKANGGSWNGMRDWGVVLFICLFICGILSLMGDQTQNLKLTNWMFTLILSGIGTLIILITFFNGLDYLSLVSFGFYGAAFGTFAVLYYAWTLRSPGDTVQKGLDSLKGSMSSPQGQGNTTTPTVQNPASSTPQSQTGTEANKPT